MKKNFLFTVIFILLISFGLTGCVFSEVRNNNETEEDKDESNREDDEEHDDDEERDDDDDEEISEIREAFEYYKYSAGSDSVKESYLIYQYNGHLYFASYYFNCGDSYSETCMLSDAQEEEFYRILDTEVEPDTEENDADDRVGAHIVAAVLGRDGERVLIYPLDLSGTELPIRDVYDVNMVEEVNIPFEGMEVIQDSDVWQSNPFWIDYYAYNCMLEEQIESRIGQELVSMSVGEMGEEDYILQAETESGETHEFTVTIWGYVTE